MTRERKGTSAPSTAQVSEKIAVICVTYCSSGGFARFSRALQRSSTVCPVRLVVVDAHSPDDTVEVVTREMPAADVCVLDANRGFAAGVNAGISHVRATGGADIFVIANPDVLVEPACISFLAQRMRDTEVGVVCPRLLSDGGDRQDSLRRVVPPAAVWATALFGGRLSERLGLPVEVVRDPRWYRYAHDVGWATGALLAVSDSCLETVGPWAEHFFMYEEEVEFCARARSKGFRIRYEPRAMARRHNGEDHHAPWRYALVRANKVRSMTGVGRLSTAAASVVGDLIRCWRAEARAGLWAVVSRASPQEVMDRYLPGVPVEVAQEGEAPTTARLVRRGVPPSSAGGWGDPSTMSRL